MENKTVILSETADYLVCLKPVGADSEHELPALLSAECGSAVLPVHRLDLNVGGVMVYAKHREAAAEFSRLIKSGRLEKEYLARCLGCPPPEGEMRDLLFRDSRMNKVFVVKRQRAGVKEAVLSYRVVVPGKDTSLVRIRLHTGRSHQIRVQFASRRSPLVGDGKYGSRLNRKGPSLFSVTLEFPWEGSILTFTRPAEF